MLALEAEQEAEPDTHVHEAARVFEKLRRSLTRFAGAEGFTALLKRALALASSELPAARTLRVSPDGGLEGLDALIADADGVGGEAATAITAHLLGLLVTFVGQSLTLRLMQDAWPDASIPED